MEMVCVNAFWHYSRASECAAIIRRVYTWCATCYTVLARVDLRQKRKQRKLQTILIGKEFSQYLFVILGTFGCSAGFCYRYPCNVCMVHKG